MAGRWTWQTAAGLLIAAAMPAFAQDATPTCINAGNRYQGGDYACLPACHGRQRYARCDALGGAATWTYVSEVCPMALLSQRPPEMATLSVKTAMSPIPFAVAVSLVPPEAAARMSSMAAHPTTR